MFNWKLKAVKSAVEEGLSLEQVRTEMLQLMAAESANHYRMGQLYNYVVDKELAQKAGFKDARDYFSQKLADLSYSSLRMYGAVAGGFSEQISVRFGVTCLHLLLIYNEAADLELNHEEPGGTVIEVPGENGTVTSKPFSACSVDEMRKALQRKRKPASSKPLPPEALTLASEYQEVLKGRFPRGVRVKVQVRNEKGKAVLDFKGIPVEVGATLVAAMTAELPPVPEVRGVEQAPHVS